MTGVRDTTDPAVKRMRRIAQALAVIWASLWTLSAMALVLMVYALWNIDTFPRPSFGQWMMSVPPRYWLMVALPVFVGWVSAAIPWRREAIGGVVLLLEGLLVAAIIPCALAFNVFYLDRGAELLFGLAMCPVTVSFVFFVPLVAGSLFLASWWRSRRSGIPENL